jgi:hypothetical protein
MPGTQAKLASKHMRHVLRPAAGSSTSRQTLLLLMAAVEDWLPIFLTPSFAVFSPEAKNVPCLEIGSRATREYTASKTEET